MSKRTIPKTDTIMECTERKLFHLITINTNMLVLEPYPESQIFRLTTSRRPSWVELGFWVECLSSEVF